jgi:hypothetical protein
MSIVGMSWFFAINAESMDASGARSLARSYF